MRRNLRRNSGRCTGGISLKTFRNAVVLFLLFMVGTMAVVHVDRQCAMMERNTESFAETLTEKLENYIEK